jgi:hypothetical protein
MILESHYFGISQIQMDPGRLDEFEDLPANLPTEHICSIGRFLLMTPYGVLMFRRCRQDFPSSYGSNAF